MFSVALSLEWSDYSEAILRLCIYDAQPEPLAVKETAKWRTTSKSGGPMERRQPSWIARDAAGVKNVSAK